MTREQIETEIGHINAQLKRPLPNIERAGTEGR